MRHAWILLLLALPVSAEQVQVDITGQTYDPSSRSTGTFDVRFDIDTLSGIQTYNVDTPLASYLATSLAITDLTADVNGVNIFSVPSTSATVTKGASPLAQMLTQGANGLSWDIDVNAPVSITNRDDPLLGLLTQSFAPFYADSQVAIGVDGNPRAFLGEDVNVRVSRIGVPEPGTLALLLLGLAALAARTHLIKTRERAA